MTDSLAVIVAEMFKTAIENPGNYPPDYRTACNHFANRIAALEPGAGGVVGGLILVEEASCVPHSHPELGVGMFFTDAAMLAAAPKASEAHPWDSLPGWLIDHHEGDAITEELLQRALSDLLASGVNATPQADPAPPVAPDALIGKLRCLGSLLQQLNAQTAAQSVHEAIDALRDGLAAQEGAG